VTADDDDDTFNDYVNSHIFNVDNDNAFYDVQFLNGTRHSNLALNAVVINNNILACSYSSPYTQWIKPAHSMNHAYIHTRAPKSSA
jgi:hypothetical protein